MLIGNTIYRTSSCHDTLLWAKQHLDTAPDGSLFLADTLTAAKGRQGRTWEWAPGQLAVTILLKPSTYEKINVFDYGLRTNQLAMALSLGILAPLEKYGVGLKWPNDFYLDDKKVGGMLMDISWRNAMPFGIILGFAINVNNHFDNNHHLASIATSLSLKKDRLVDQNSLLNEIIITLNTWYALWIGQQFSFIVQTWKERQVFIKKTISVHSYDGSILTGIMHDILPDGNCILITPDNQEIVINFHTIHAIT